jgi:hypothetical protein
MKYVYVLLDYFQFVLTIGVTAYTRLLSIVNIIIGGAVVVDVFIDVIIIIIIIITLD